MEQFNTDSLECPKCHAGMIGEPIPPKNRWLYGGKSAYTRVITVQKDGDTVGYGCPDCGYQNRIVAAIAAA
jgi:hypothetical protein